MPKRRGRKSAAQTPAPRSERIYGSKKNKPGSASSEKSASKIVLSQEITDALKKKADEYNDKHSNKVSLSDLKAVFRRGAGAYSKSHRPTITGGRPNSRNAWAYARVNKFLKKKAGQKVKAAYVQDDDLLKDGGKLSDVIVTAHRNYALFQIKDGKKLAGEAKLTKHRNIEEAAEFFPSTQDYLQKAKYLKEHRYRACEEGWELEYIEVFPDYQNKGYGKKLLNEVKKWAKKNSVNVIFVYAQPYGEASVEHDYKGGLKYKALMNFYQKNGFEKISSHELALDLQKRNERQFEDGGEIEDVTTEELEFLKKRINDSGPLLRKFMDKEDIKMADILVKKGWMEKGYSDDSTPSVIYYVDLPRDKRQKLEDSFEDGGRLEELLAPNGKPSNLTPEQYKLVRTTEFKAWFGDWEKDPENASKVVDENGEPLVVYHGTYIETPFYEFRKYSYWTDSYESAKSFPTIGYELNAEGQMYNPEAENIWKNFKSENVRVYSCFIKLKNPKIFNYEEERFEFQDIEVEEGMPLPKILESLLEQGYDSMRMSGGDEEHFIVFEPNQIKLADGSNTTFDEGNPDIRYDNGGYILVRNDAYDTSIAKRRLPYLGVSAFSIKESDFDGLKQYAQREYEVAPESWTILKIEDFGNCTVSAMKMEETNDYVMQFSDQKPIQEQYQPEKHSLNFEDGSVDYEDAYEVMIQPVPKYSQGGMAAMLLKDTIDSADNINAMVVYSLENDVNPKKLSEKEFNEKINPDGKYSDFEVRLAKRELKKYFADGGQPENMEITCQKCGWSWDSSETTPEEMMICHKCGHNNLLPVESETASPYSDTIQMNGPAFLRALKFAREDAKTDMDLHKLTENAIRLSKSGLISMEQYEQMVPEVQMADEGVMVMEEPVEEKYISVEEYIQKEKDEAEAVECCEMSKLSKIMICQGKIDLAENKIKQTESVSEQQAWSFIESIWRKCLKDVQNDISKNYKKGGKTDCGCSKYDKGGLAYGNSHDNGGMPLVVKSTGQNIEIEGGEGVVNKRSMKSDKKVEFEGKKMTPCEVVSKINQMGGGVKFKCDDVKDIIAEDGNF